MTGLDAPKKVKFYYTTTKKLNHKDVIKKNSKQNMKPSQWLVMTSDSCSIAAATQSQSRTQMDQAIEVDTADG